MLLRKANILAITSKYLKRANEIQSQKGKVRIQINSDNSQKFANRGFLPHYNLMNKVVYQFSRNVKSANKLILYSEQQIENLHTANYKKRSRSGSQQERQWSVFAEKSQKYKVSLIGLPNSGKSSLFNCMIGERLAIVDKQYGMTRDRREFNILNGLVKVVDTPGVEVSLLSKNKAAFKGNKLNQQNNIQQRQNRLKEDIFQQTLKAINQSDMVIFVIDAKKEVISQGEIILAKYLKAFNHNGQSNNNKKCQIVIACNKCDGMAWDQNDLLNEIYTKLPVLQSFNNEQAMKSLGKSDNIFYCSAEEGTGIFQLLQYIDKKIPFQLKQANEKKRKERRERFEKLVKKMKQQIRQINQKQQLNEKMTSNQNQQEEQNQEQSNGKDSKSQKKQTKITHKKIKIKQWQEDFRSLNPNPQQNQELDYQNYEDFFIRPEQSFSAGKRGVDIKNLKMKHTIKICFIGRPNVGKSSLINQIIGQEKLVVSEVPHTTRDAMATKVLYKNRKIEIIDTAGLNTPRFEQNEQQYLRKVQYSTMLHVRQSHIVCYVMDAFNAFRVDDFVLINRVIKQGRPVVIVVNKWQAIKQQYKNKARNYLMSQIDKNLGELNGYPIVFVSAKMLLNIDQMMDRIITTYDKWNKRISTGLLNNWLQKFKKLDNLPKDQGATLKINYIIQARVRPPHFIFFVNNKQIFKNNYMRFLTKNMAEQFQLDGIPLRHTLRSTNNKQNMKRTKAKTTKPNRKTKAQQKMQQLKKKYGDFTI